MIAARNPGRGQPYERTDWRTKLRPKAPVDMTVADLVNQYLDDLAERGESYQPTTSKCQAQVIPDLGWEPASILEQPEIIEAILRARRSDGLAPNTLHSIKATFVRLTDFGVAIGACKQNGARMIAKAVLPRRKPRDPHRQERLVLSQPQAERLITDKRIPVWRRFTWAVGLLQGYRRGELSGLVQRDIDLTAEPLPVITCERQLHKSGKIGPLKERDGAKTMPMHPTVLDLYREITPSLWIDVLGREPQPDDPLVPFWASGKNRMTKLRPWSHSNMLIHLRDDLALIGVPEHKAGLRGIHTLRHSCASLYRNAGCDPSVVCFWIHPAAARAASAHALYVHFSHAMQCAEIAKLRIGGAR